MKKVKILSTALILLIGMFFMVQSCQKEDLNVASDFEKQFSLNEFKDEFVKTNLMVNWNDFKKSESQDENTHYIFNASLKTNGSIHNSNGSLDFKYQILANVNKDGKTSFEILKFLSNDSNSVKEVSFNSLHLFSGTLYQYDLKGELLKMTAFKNGIELEKIAGDKMILMSQSKYAPKEEGWVIVRTEFWTDWYKSVGGVWVYTHSTLNNVTYEWVYVGNYDMVDSGYHLHSDNLYTGHPNPGINTHTNEITFDPTVTPCIQNVICLLQEKDRHYSVVPNINDQSFSHIAQTILDLFNASKEYSLNFSISQLGVNADGNERNATTTPLSSGKGWQIIIDSDLANNGTQLFIAKSIIHEAVHAYINYVLKTDATSDMVSDLNKLHQKFLTSSSSANLTQHEFMSQFVEAFAYSLAAWDNHKLSMDYYKMLSWGGLESSTAYSQLTNKTEIQNAIQNERYGKKDAKGTKCN